MSTLFFKKIFSIVFSFFRRILSFERIFFRFREFFFLICFRFHDNVRAKFSKVKRSEENSRDNFRILSKKHSGRNIKFEHAEENLFEKNANESIRTLFERKKFEDGNSILKCNLSKMLLEKKSTKIFSIVVEIVIRTSNMFRHVRDICRTTFEQQKVFRNIFGTYSKKMAEAYSEKSAGTFSRRKHSGKVFQNMFCENAREIFKENIPEHIQEECFETCSGKIFETCLKEVIQENVRSKYSKHIREKISGKIFSKHIWEKFSRHVRKKILRNIFRQNVPEHVREGISGKVYLKHIREKKYFGTFSKKNFETYSGEVFGTYWRKHSGTCSRQLFGKHIQEKFQVKYFGTYLGKKCPEHIE